LHPNCNSVRQSISEHFVAFNENEIIFNEKFQNQIKNKKTSRIIITFIKELPSLLTGSKQLSSLYLCPIEFKEVKIIEDSFIIFS
jgi:hypothetical protein